MPTSKDIPLGHEVIVHGSMTTKTTLHNGHKKPQQEVPHNLKWFFYLNTHVIPVIIISPQLVLKQKLPLNGKERGNNPLPLPPTKNPNRAYQIHENVMAQIINVVETNINTF
jgi:hypothetical protein